MIYESILFFNSNQDVITFICHSIIFLGSFYVALHNRTLPQWIITPLWYVGMFSLLAVFTIAFQWTLGPEFPLSYWNFGQLAESLVDISIATISGIMLFNTVKQDVYGSRNRRKKQKES